MQISPIFFILGGSFVSIVQAHMELSLPIPLASKLDPLNVAANIDYNMMRPLDPSGADFPCLNHHLTPGQQRVSTTYKAGGTYQIEISGQAPHGGGSCQLSLSYDNGVTFRVIKSMVGNCPVQTRYDFTVPLFAPAGKDVLFAWTWFNKLGNREMYMNCARVEVQSDSTAGGGMEQVPEIFKANVFGGACITPDGEDVVFPNSGEDVVYGVAELQGAPPVTIDGCPSQPAPAKGKAPAKGNAPSPAPLPPAVTPTKALQPSTMITATRSLPASLSTATLPAQPSIQNPTTLRTSTLKSTPSTPATSGSCNPEEIRCSSSGKAWSTCSNGGFIEMGPVAGGMICHEGAIVRDSPLGPCDSSLNSKKCLDGGKRWAVCAQGTWIDMGPTAPGVACSNA